MTSLKLINNKKEWIFFTLFFTTVFILNIFYEYNNYLDFKDEKIYTTNAHTINKYPKEDFDIYKFQNEYFTFFTSTSKDLDLRKLDFVKITILTKNISFYEYLKGFYTKSFNIFKIEQSSLKKEISTRISNQHKNQDISEIFNALFLAIPTNNELRDTFAIYSISHLIAISGFHLAVLSFVIYFITYPIYNFFHNRYFPYRNKKFDILIFTIFILLCYLIFTNLVPSLLRSFVMLVFGLYMLRSNIKVISFQTLLFTLILIIVLFPKYLFSISLWFSIIGVFYIFLFIKYFVDLPKWFLFIFFNIWIFASFNPIVHYFFGVTSWIQLLSPFITTVFTLFYPFELFLHIIGYGNLLDEYLEYFINLKFFIYDIATPLWFFILYVVISLLSIFSKSAFLILNILLLGFNIYLYY